MANAKDVFGNVLSKVGGVVSDEAKGLYGEKGIQGFGQALAGVPMYQALGSASKNIAGNGQAAGDLGIGQFTAQPYNVDPTAFTGQNTNQWMNQYNINQQLGAKSLQNRAAPMINVAGQPLQAAQINQTNSGQDRSAQLGLQQQLQNQANGTGGPSLAQQQLQQATDRNIQQSMGLATSTQGQQQGGLALRQIANQSANTANQAGQQSAQLRSQEMLNAQQQLAGVNNQLTNSDIGLAENQAQLNQQAGIQNQNVNYNVGLANQNAKIANQNEIDKQNLGLLGAQNTSANEQAQNAMALQALQAQQQLGNQGLDERGYASASQARSNLLGNMGSAAAGLPGLISSLTKAAPAAAPAAATVLAAYSGGKVGGEPIQVRVSPGEIIIPPEVASRGYDEMDDFVNALQGKKKDEEDDDDGYAHGGRVVAHIPKGIRTHAGRIPTDPNVPETPAEEEEQEQEYNEAEEEAGPSEGGEEDFSQALAHGGRVKPLPLMAKGGIVPGTPVVAGDSPANDKVHVMLKPGSVVMPRSAVENPDLRSQFLRDLMGASQSTEEEPDLAAAFKSKKRA